MLGKIFPEIIQWKTMHTHQLFCGTGRNLHSVSPMSDRKFEVFANSAIDLITMQNDYFVSQAKRGAQIRTLCSLNFQNLKLLNFLLKQKMIRPYSILG
jgi:hypothetical protein